MTEEAKPKDLKDLFIQYVIIQLGDGRRGIFMGPELISATELKSNPPKIAEIVFLEPKPRESILEEKKEEGLQQKEVINPSSKKDLVL